MAVELKNAADRYELLEKENKASSADLNKALNATKEMRTEVRGVREELQQAAKSRLGAPTYCGRSFWIRSMLPWMDAGVLQMRMRTWRRVQPMQPSFLRIKMIKKWRSLSGRSSMLPRARCRLLRRWLL